MANASTTTLRLYSDSVISIPTGSNIHGATNQQQGYRMASDGSISYFGTQTYTWDRTNYDATTYTGYYVDTTAIDPPKDNNTCAYFTTTGTVHWGVQQSGTGGTGN